MRSIAIMLFAAVSFGCTSASQQVQSNTALPASAANDRPQSVIAHSSENQPQPAVKSGERTKWAQAGQPIDTKALDDAIKASEKAGPKAQGAAYYNRALALTKAGQYASALGDYRKAVKLDPSNADAKEWVEKIMTIYDGMNKEAPAEGEEPPPLPLNK